MIDAELDRLRRDGLSDTELVAAKGHLTGSLSMSLETSASRMRRIGRAEMIEGDVPTLDEVVARIEPSATPTSHESSNASSTARRAPSPSSAPTTIRLRLTRPPCEPA